MEWNLESSKYHQARFYSVPNHPREIKSCFCTSKEEKYTTINLDMSLNKIKKKKKTGVFC